MPTTTDSNTSTGPSPRFLAFLFGGFGILAILILLGSWPGYQLSRHSKASAAAEERGDYAAVASHLEYVTKRYPDAWLRMTQLGDAYLETGKPAEALMQFENSLNVNPDQNMKARLGRAHFLLGDKPQAMKFLKEAIEKDPNDPHANFFIALYYMDEGNYARASFFFEAAGSDKKLFEKSRPYLDEIKTKLLDTPAPITSATPTSPSVPESPPVTSGPQ